MRNLSSQRRYLSIALSGCALSTACGAESPQAEPATETQQSVLSTSSLLATATLAGDTDQAPFSYALENGLPQNVLGGIGSGLAWAGGTTFLAVPDRGPNATGYAGGAAVDNTSSFIARVETLDLPLAPSTSGSGLPFVLTPTLSATTLLFSDTALQYGNTAGLPSAVPAANEPSKFYFTGRSDNFGAGMSTDPSFARLDPEAIRVANDGKTVFIADEYGPYVYQFDRATGRRLRSYALPSYFAIQQLSSVGATEISSNSEGRVTNKGIEGLAITPDGSTIVALVQSPLLQDGGDGARPNRIVTIDVASGGTHEYVYDNQIGTKAFNSSEIIALNDHQFLIDTRDGKGLGDGSTAVVKQLWAVDIAGAQDVSGLSGASSLLPLAAPKKLFVDMVKVLNANGIASTQIPAKLEGLAFGSDLVVNGTVTHTLYVANDNDFIPAVAGPSRWFVFGFTDADLSALGLSYTPQHLTERGPDLVVTKSASAATAITGSTVAYTLNVQNVGLVPAKSVSLSDVLPNELAFVSCSSVGTCNSGSNGATVTFASLAATSAQAATVTAKVSCAVANGTVISNQAAASSTTLDPTPNDNIGVANITAVNPAPAINSVSADKTLLWPPNGKMSTVHLSYDVSDNCAGATCSLAVSSNQGNATDWAVIDAHTVQLRAKRTLNAPRVYNVAISCVDSGGAVSVANAAVTVPHDERESE